MGMKTFVGRYSTCTGSLDDLCFEVMPVPKARKITVVDYNGTIRINQVLNLAYRVNRAEFMRGDAYNTSRGTKLPEDWFHLITDVIQVVLIANENEILFAREHIDDMCNYWLTINFN